MKTSSSAKAGTLCASSRKSFCAVSIIKIDNQCKIFLIHAQSRLWTC